MPKELKSIEPKIVEHIASSIEFLGDVPEGFAEDFRQWAQQWSKGQGYKNSAHYQIWNIELRPYKVSELARVPGMPRRTKLHEILNELGIPKNEMRDAGGKLKISVVKMILDHLTER